MMALLIVCVLVELGWICLMSTVGMCRVWAVLWCGQSPQTTPAVCGHSDQWSGVWGTARQDMLLC